MKKFTTLLLVLMMLTLTACSGSDSNMADSSNTGNNKNNNNEQESSTEKEIISKEGDVLVDNEYCKITYMGLYTERSNLFGKFSIENKTDIKIAVDFQYGSVNGLICNWNQSIKVDPNSSEEIARVIADDYVLAKAGMKAEDISVVDFVLEVWSSDPVTYYHQESHTLYPVGSNSTTHYERTSTDTDIVLIDNDVCKITYLGYEKEVDDPLYFNLYIENKTDKELRLAFPASRVDGKLKAVTHNYPTLTGGTSMYYSPSWWSLEEYSMDDINTVELAIEAYVDQKYATPAMDEVVTVTP